jgi:hypothetical protein
VSRAEAMVLALGGLVAVLAAFGLLLVALASV